MTTDDEITLAFLFKRSGKPTMTDSELYLSLSMDLGWMTATEAQHFVSHSKDTKLLIEHPTGLAPAFPIGTIDIPRGFTPKKQHQKEKTTPPPKDQLMDRILQRIHQCTGQPVDNLATEATALAAEKHITLEVAGLWLAHRRDCDVTDFYDTIHF